MLQTSTFFLACIYLNARMPNGSGRRDQKKDSFLFDRFCIAKAVATGIPDKGELVVAGMGMVCVNMLVRYAGIEVNAADRTFHSFLLHITSINKGNDTVQCHLICREEGGFCHFGVSRSCTPPARQFRAVQLNSPYAQV